MKPGRRAVRVCPQDYGALLTPEQSERLRGRRDPSRRRIVEEWAAAAPPEWNSPPRWVLQDADARTRWERERAAVLEGWEREAAGVDTEQWKRSCAAILDKWADERRAFLERWEPQPGKQ